MPFAARWQDRDVFEAAEELPKSKASYSLYFEMALAAKWWGCPWPTFKELDGDTKAEMLMAYRTARLLEALETKDAAKEAEPRGKGSR